ncbi:hypothetical protein KNZ06_00980 [Streptococcus dysgalactiae subsp. equisimilis]|nr:hypothetical protein KNZ06_00980 [Streptococcus dysgalactiae subsp. equisimilis]
MLPHNDLFFSQKTPFYLANIKTVRRNNVGFLVYYISHSMSKMLLNRNIPLRFHLST